MTFKIDANGLLKVTAKDVRKGHSKSITITSDDRNLSKDRIARLILQGELEREQAAQCNPVKAA